MNDTGIDCDVNELLKITSAETYFYLVVLFTIIVIGLPVNLILFMTIYKTKKLHSVHNTLMLNLCICNAVTCVLPTSFTSIALIYHLTQKTHITPICYLRHLTLYAGFFPGFVTLILLSFEKHDAIIRPFTKRLSKRRLRYALALLWVSTAVGGVGVTIEYWMSANKKCFLKLRGSSTYLYYGLTMGLFLLMFIITLYCYIRIVLALTIHQNGFTKSIQQQQRLEKGPLQMIAVLTVMLILLWGPPGLVRWFRPGDGNSGMWPHAYVATGVMVYLTAVCHPITCFVMSSQLRKAARRLWRKSQGFDDGFSQSFFTQPNSREGTLMRGIPQIQLPPVITEVKADDSTDEIQASNLS